MRSLSEAQAEFVHAILTVERSIKGIIPTGKLTVEGALNVYQRGYVARLTEALGETFEACWWALGDERFFEVCELYIVNHPSNVDNLSHYGRDFPEFLKSIPEFSDFPFLTDLALFEIHFADLFHQREESSLSQEEISKKTTAATDFRIEFSSNHFIFESRFAIHEIWKSRTVSSDINSKPEIDWNRSQILLASKQNELIKIAEISASQACLIKLLRKGQSVGEAVARMDDDSLFAVSELKGLFQLISSMGLLKQIVPISY